MNTLAPQHPASSRSLLAPIISVCGAIGSFVLEVATLNYLRQISNDQQYMAICHLRGLHNDRFASAPSANPLTPTALTAEENSAIRRCHDLLVPREILVELAPLYRDALPATDVPEPRPA